MKSIHVTFEDHEFESLLKAKADLSWHDFIMKTIRYDALEVLYDAAMRQLECSGNDQGLIEQFKEDGDYAEEYAIYQGYKNAREYAIDIEQSTDDFFECFAKKMKEKEIKRANST